MLRAMTRPVLESMAQSMVGAVDDEFSPLDLNPSLWLDASDTSTITEIGGSVSQWDDKSGNNRHATQGTAAAQPTTNSVTVNGLNAISFDGMNDFMSYDGTFLAGTDYSVYAVLQRNSGKTDNYFFGSADGTTNGNLLFGYESDTNVRLGHFVAASADVTIPAYTSPSPDILIAKLEAGVGGTAIVNTSSNTDAGLVQLSSYNNAQLGRLLTTLYSDNDSCEILMFPIILTAQEDADVRSYLGNKWGTP